jgi:hypothetical protein
MGLKEHVDYNTVAISISKRVPTRAQRHFYFRIDPMPVSCPLGLLHEMEVAPQSVNQQDRRLRNNALKIIYNTSAQLLFLVRYP